MVPELTNWPCTIYNQSSNAVDSAKGEHLGRICIEGRKFSLHALRRAQSHGDRLSLQQQMTQPVILCLERAFLARQTPSVEPLWPEWLRSRRCRFPRTRPANPGASRGASRIPAAKQTCHRRATLDTRVPGTSVSATILGFLSVDQRRRRPGPVRTSTRRTLPFASSLTSNIRIVRSPLPQATQALRGRPLNEGITEPRLRCIYAIRTTTGWNCTGTVRQPNGRVTARATGHVHGAVLTLRTY